MKRDAAQTIFRTVVFAGAMLGTGCGPKKPAQPTTPSTTQPATTDNATPDNATPADPCAATPPADPCAANNPCRPRPNTDPCARPTGRGFVLS